jgi:hypothetical protein
MRQMSTLIMSVVSALVLSVGAQAAPIAEFLVPESSGTTTANSGTEGPATGSLGAGVSFSASEPANGLNATGSSLSFDGNADARVSVGAFSSLQSNYNEVTVMAWVNIPDFNSVTLRHVIHVSNASSGLPTGFVLGVDNANRIIFTYRDDNDVIFAPVSDGNAITLDEWVHIAVTADFPNSTLTYYVNGSAFGSIDALDPARSIKGDASTLLALGRLVGVNASMMKGGLDDARVYMSILTPGQIQAAAVLVPEPGTAMIVLCSACAVLTRRGLRRHRDRAVDA